MYINMKRIYRYGLLMVVGMSLIFYGMIQMVIEDHSMDQITDEEVIERARGLGMKGLEETLLENKDE